MNVDDEAPRELPNSILLIISVILTVLVALFLAFSDELQTRLPLPIRPTAIVQSEIGTTPSPQPTPTDSPQPSGTPAPTAVPTATESVIIAEATCNNVPEDWIPVVVGSEENLYNLAIRYGAAIGELIQANCLDSAPIISGATIYVPPTPPTRLPCGPPQSWLTYIVRPGDTLSALAVRHRTTVFAIMQANCLVETRIFAGRSLYLPPIPPPPATATPSRTPTATSTATATVQPSPTTTATPDATTAVTPTPTGSPVATSAATPTASATPTLDATASPTPTVGATETAVPTATPTAPPTNTPPPTQPPTNTPQPTATEAPPPSETPEF